MTSSVPLLSVIVPCYNEEGNLSLCYERLKAALAQYRLQGTEILFIDDGSEDDTWALIGGLGAEDDNVTGIRLSRNFGQQMALSCGIRHARGKRVLVIDADLQDPPELLPEMMAKMDEGFDVVYGQRIGRQGDGAFKKGSAWLFYRLLNQMSDIRIPVDTGDFRLMSRKVVRALADLPERVRFTRGLVSWLGFRQAPVRYVRQPRHAGETHYPLRAMLRFATEGLASFSTRPLQLATWMGVIMMVISMLLLSYVFISWLLFATVRGWTSLTAIFLLSQALQWLMLGVIGNYLAIIFREIKSRPLYIVDEIINGAEGTE